MSLAVFASRIPLSLLLSPFCLISGKKVLLATSKQPPLNLNKQIL